MQKKYLALLHKIGFTHKILFKIFEKDNWNFEDFYENLSFSNLEKLVVFYSIMKFFSTTC